MSNEESISEIVLEDSAKLFEKNRLLIANRKWIIDGHHRWAYVYALNPNASIPCININLPEQSPLDILKDVQIAIAATYGDLYFREQEIEYNISRMDDDSIKSLLYRVISKENLFLLQSQYAKTDYKKQILKFIIPEDVLEESVSASDYVESELKTELPDDPDIIEMENTPDSKTSEDGDVISSTDLEGSEGKKNFSNALDVVGWLDPTGIADMTQAIIALRNGNYMLFFGYFISALPMGDILGKAVVTWVKSYASKKILQFIGRAMKKLDAESFARIMIKIEKKFPDIADFLNWMKDNLLTLINKMGEIADRIGKHWIQFKIFYSIFTSKIKQFFEEVFNWKERLKKYLNYATREDVLSVIYSNLLNIKGLIVDKKVDLLNNNFAIGPHPVQTAQKKKKNPYGGDFKGVPVEFLSNIPKVMGYMRLSKEDKEQRFQKFVNFADTKGGDNGKNTPQILGTILGSTGNTNQTVTVPQPPPAPRV